MTRPSAAGLLNHPWLTQHPPTELGPLLARCARASGAGVRGSGSASGMVGLSASWGTAAGGGGLSSAGGARASGSFSGASSGSGGSLVTKGGSALQSGGSSGGGGGSAFSGSVASWSQAGGPTSSSSSAPGALDAAGVRPSVGGSTGLGALPVLAAPQLQPVSCRAPMGEAEGKQQTAGSSQLLSCQQQPAPSAPPQPQSAAGPAAASARPIVSVGTAAAGAAARGVVANNRYSALRGVPGKTLGRRSSSSSGSGSGSGSFGAAAAAAVAAMNRGYEGASSSNLSGRPQQLQRR